MRNIRERISEETDGMIWTEGQKYLTAYRGRSGCGRENYESRESIREDSCDS